MNHSDRFSGITRLYGPQALQRLQLAHVCVVGLGGVGSWTAEALARSGVGTLTLVDLDEVCISNTNRQLHALDSTIGSRKVDVLAARMRAINPEIAVHSVADFLTPDNVTDILSPQMSFVVDAVDDAPAKTSMVLACTDLQLPLVLSGGAGGKRDAAAVRIADLTETTNDGLLRRLRKRLRRLHGFQPGACWNLSTVFSPERQVFPGPNGEICELRAGDGPTRLDCATGFGAATFVTGSFGFAAASVVVESIAHGRRPTPTRGEVPSSSR